MSSESNDFDDLLKPPPPEGFTKSAAEVPTFYADLTGYVYLQNGNYRFTLVENVADAPESPFGTWKSRPVVNIVMPAEGLENMLTYIGNFVAEMKAQAASNGE